MFKLKRAFRVQTAHAPVFAGVMTVFEHSDQWCRVVIDFDFSGVHRSYHRPGPASDISVGKLLILVLPNGVTHLYDVVKEIEVSEGTKQVKLMSASVGALPKVTSRG